MSAEKNKLNSLFNPESIAVVGASRDPSKVGHTVLSNILQGSAEVEIYPINPKAEKIKGQKCYSSVTDIPSDVDLAVITIPADGVLTVIEDCIEKDVNVAIIISAGFGETEAGKERETKLKEMISGSDLRVVGPNVFGHILPGRLSTVFLDHEPYSQGRIGFITQSGAMGFLLLDRMDFYGIDASAFINIGNKIDISENDLISYLANDKNTECIVCYLESFSDGREFLKVCDSVSEKVPIVVLKAGSTEAGAKAAASHTGALATSDVAVSGAFKQAGVIRAQDEEELMDFANALANGKPIFGNKVAVVSPAGGSAVVSADLIEDTKRLKMAELKESTQEKIKAKIPPIGSSSNPIDITADSTPEMVDNVLEELQQDDNVDSILMFSSPQPPRPVTDELIKVVTKWAKEGKPMVVSTIENKYSTESVRKYASRGVPIFPSIKRAVKALTVLKERG